MRLRYDILLAEDEDMLRNFIDVSLKRAGYTVVAVEDGTQAIEAFQKFGFSVLISDIKMPGLNGFDLAQRVLSEIDPGVKIIFITGFNAVALEAKDKYSDSAVILSKPFHLKELIKHLDKILAADLQDNTDGGETEE